MKIAKRTKACVKISGWTCQCHQIVGTNGTTGFTPGGVRRAGTKPDTQKLPHAISISYNEHAMAIPTKPRIIVSLHFCRCQFFIADHCKRSLRMPSARSISTILCFDEPATTTDLWSRVLWSECQSLSTSWVSALIQGSRICCPADPKAHIRRTSNVHNLSSHLQATPDCPSH